MASTEPDPQPARHPSGQGRRERWPARLHLPWGVWVLVAMVVVLVLGGSALAGWSVASRSSGGSPSAAAPGGQHTPVSGLPTVALADLPVQARQVVATIDAHGSFRYAQDGTVFGNDEHLLPDRPDGYYHEYTVPTPGSPDRGTRRLVLGRDGDLYYTADHYASFRQVLR